MLQKTKFVCLAGNGKIIKMRPVFKSHGTNPAPNHQEGISGWGYQMMENLCGLREHFQAMSAQHMSEGYVLLCR